MLEILDEDTGAVYGTRVHPGKPRFPGVFEGHSQGSGIVGVISDV